MTILQIKIDGNEMMILPGSSRWQAVNKGPQPYSKLNKMKLRKRLIYTAHHLYPSFLLYTGIRRNRALARYNPRTSEKDQILHRV